MSTRDIPEAIKREVRQASFFGCVICGMPLYHYEHVQDFAEEQTHKVSNIVLLCPNHHQDKTSGRLSRELILRHQNTPKNANRDHTTIYPVLLAGDVGVLTVGSNRFEYAFSPEGGRFDAIVIDGEVVMALESQSGNLLLDLCLTDRQGGVILRVHKGELVISTGVWDYSLEGNMLHIRSAPRLIDLQIEFAYDGVDVQRGTFVRPPHGAEIEPGSLTILPMRLKMSGNVLRNCRYGVVVGHQPRSLR